VPQARIRYEYCPRPQGVSVSAQQGSAGIFAVPAKTDGRKHYRAIRRIRFCAANRATNPQDTFITKPKGHGKDRHHFDAAETPPKRIYNKSELA